MTMFKRFAVSLVLRFMRGGEAKNASENIE